MLGKMMKNLVSGYSKTVVSHCRGCIFQGFQSLQKVGKTSSEIDSKWPQNLLKSALESSPRRSLKLQWKILKIWWKKVSKMRSKKVIVLMILATFFEVWVQRCPRVVPGTFPGSPQGQKSSTMGVKMTPKSSTNVVQRLSENGSQKHTR